MLSELVVTLRGLMVMSCFHHDVLKSSCDVVCLNLMW